MNGGTIGRLGSDPNWGLTPNRGYVRRVRDRYLLPREHGAYAQLGFPLLSGLVLGAPGLASFLFAAAAIGLFIANEPLLLLLGVRGKRLQEELRVPAGRQLALRAGFGALAGLGAFWLAPDTARWLALVPALCVAGLLPLVVAKRLKTLGGECLAAAAFAAMHLPVAASGGVTGLMLYGPPVLWFVATIVSTLCVHAIKSRVTGATPWVQWVAPLATRFALFAVLVVTVTVPAWRPVAVAACLPLAGVLVLNRLAPSTKRLKQVGWTLVATQALALALLAATGT